MGDVASPSYPGAPPPSQGLLQGDPSRAVGLLGQIQDFQIRQQQAPALGQIPAASLAGQHIANATAQQAQEAAATATIRNALATSLAGTPNPTADDVHSAIVNVSRANPHIAVTMPGIINAQGDFLLKDGPKGIKTNAGTLLNMGLSPEGASSRVAGPPDASGAPTSISVPQANQGGPKGIQTGLAPGSEESARVMQGDLSRAGNFGQEIFPWQQALQKIQALGPGGTGPGTKGRQDFESFLYAASPQISTMLGVDPKKIENYAEAEKYLTNATQQRAAGFGSHTDMQLATALSGSPNVHINDLAAENVTKAAIALRRMEHAQTLQNATGGPVSYTSNKAKWAASQDPRAYALDMMTPAQIQALDKSLKGSERAKFNASLKAAQDSGVLTPPQASGQ